MKRFGKVTTTLAVTAVAAVGSANVNWNGLVAGAAVTGIAKSVLGSHGPAIAPKVSKTKTADEAAKAAIRDEGKAGVGKTAAGLTILGAGVYGIYEGQEYLIEKGAPAYEDQLEEAEQEGLDDSLKGGYCDAFNDPKPKGC
jgi:hypothetical protein